MRTIDYDTLDLDLMENTINDMANGEILRITSHNNYFLSTNEIRHIFPKLKITTENYVKHSNGEFETYKELNLPTIENVELKESEVTLEKINNNTFKSFVRFVVEWSLTNQKATYEKQKIIDFYQARKCDFLDFEPR